MFASKTSSGRRGRSCAFLFLLSLCYVLPRMGVQAYGGLEEPEDLEWENFIANLKAIPTPTPVAEVETVVDTYGVTSPFCKMSRLNCDFFNAVAFSDSFISSVKYYEEKKADIYGKNQDGCTGLYVAVFFQKRSAIDYFLSKPDYPINAQADGQGMAGETALVAAARMGLGDVVAKLLAHKDINPNIPDYLGNTALVEAARNGHAAIVNLILNHKYFRNDIGSYTYKMIDFQVDRAIKAAEETGQSTIAECLKVWIGAKQAMKGSYAYDQALVAMKALQARGEDCKRVISESGLTHN